jgi:hypothetical protein
MSTTGGPGQGLTLGLSQDQTLSRLRNIQLPEWATDPVDFTGLSDLEWFRFLSASLVDGGIFSAELYFNSEIARPTPRLVQTATITFALQTAGNTTPAVLSGSGFVIGVGYPNASVGEPMIETLTFKFDGIDVVPTFTAETA